LAAPVVRVERGTHLGLDSVSPLHNASTTAGANGYEHELFTYAAGSGTVCWVGFTARF
jgi:hypothetical protein